MSRKYYINSKEVTIHEWREAFAKFADSTVILRVQKLPNAYEPPETEDVISPERARELQKWRKSK